ncbi:uncharacterized protein BHQ10_009465 [Talaromyces amestolkiae]|uniref:PNPLA domain-containing protein n=1 Tax=Talaromyces amestolkiae TaxID=1196081 RepID=A0A364LCF0_TALAM|nr:uncharacterized protein BHQ10_009465 [Talaromyces amestolkiae]RAO73453.1 hypothetical protein BHQ10_009465 [Talaromyces amestolkiae]
MQAQATFTGGKPSSVDETGLCLLSLDGGGVRGLSTLFVLKSIMDEVNEIREPGSPRLKPCDLFDLIGGTSTGGIIAIMLGRLEMDVDECIKAYVKLMERVFKDKLRMVPLGWKLEIKSKFNQNELKAAILDVLTEHDVDENTLFNDGKDRKCRVFVCAAAKATTGITRLRSYKLRGVANIDATICEAALATSAATSFFDTVSIGLRRFVDGALGANNPVDQVEAEASTIWCPKSQLQPHVKCFLSIGTGKPSTQGIDDSALKIHTTLANIATETESTERNFIERWAGHFSENRYFRFNVEQGLQNVGLEEYNQQELIQTATYDYIEHIDCKFRREKCVENLILKKFKTPIDFATTQTKYLRHIAGRIPFRGNIPFHPNERFIKRENELSELEKLLFSTKSVSRIAIYGLGGVGKTQIALDIAHQTQAKGRGNPECEEYAVLWIQAMNFESVQKSYTEIAGGLKLPGADDQNADVKTLVKNYLNKTTGKWLLIFDNADDYDMWFGESSEDAKSGRLSEFLPQSENGRILFTTRLKKIASRLARKAIKVEELSEKKAKELLSQHLDNSTLLQDDNEVLQLLGKLAFLPLAVVQAASFINENSITRLSDYKKLLDRPEQEVIDLLSEDFETDGRYNGVKNPVITTWLVSFEHIRKEPLAASYLYFIACIEPKDIPESLLPPARSPMEKAKAIGTLKAYSFVNQNETNNSLSFHRLVHLATRNWLRTQKPPFKLSLKSSFLSALERMSGDFPVGEHKDQQKWRAYMPHALSLLRADETQGMPQRYQLVYSVGICLYRDGRIREAVCFLEEAAWWTRNEDQKSHSRLASEHVLAIVYHADGQIKLALKRIEHVVAVREKVLTEDHPDRLASEHVLAIVYHADGQLEAAVKLLEHVVAVKEKALTEDHPSRMESQHALMRLYQCIKKINARES